MFMEFVIWSVAAFIFLLIGISVRKSREAAGFYTFAKKPVVSDIKNGIRIGGFRCETEYPY